MIEFLKSLWSLRVELLLVIVLSLGLWLKRDFKKIDDLNDKVASIAGQMQANMQAYQAVVNTIDQKEKADNDRRTFIKSAETSLASKADGDLAPVLADAYGRVRARSAAGANKTP